MNKLGIKPSTWYYVWGMFVAIAMNIFNLIGISVWIYTLPLAFFGAYVLLLLERWLEPNRHVDEE